MRRVMLVVSFCLVAVFSSVGISSAATVSYIAGGSLWLSTPDGSKKHQLAGPTDDARVWSEQAQSDNGKIVAVRREPGKVAQLNSMTLFGPSGAILQQGSLTHKPGYSTYAYPVSLDLTNDGFAVYGYSNSAYGYPYFTYHFGTYARTVEKVFALEPFEISDWSWPTLYGDRLVASQKYMCPDSGTAISVQPSAEQNPFNYDMNGFLCVPSGIDVNRTDVAANGKIVGIELNYDTIEFYPIDRVSDVGQDTTVGSGGCVLPVQGEASQVTISQDGKNIAWEDDRGVVSAGAPNFDGSDPCNLTRAPVVLAAGGKYPSIGAAVIPGSGGGGGVLTPVPTVPAKIKAAALKNGIWITVKVAKAGSISVTGKVGQKLVARGNAKARKAGKVRMKLVATGAYRNRLGQFRGRTLVIKVTSAGKSKTVTRVLK